MGILEVHDVSIRYMTGDFKDIGLKEYVTRRLTGNYHVVEFWADHHITFSLEKGDMLGIIGTNGAGKSTLLKAISGIMEPTGGYIKREGNIAALLELASGFDGDLTVRENTYLRGAMLGYTRKFMDEKYPKIIEFAELQEFQDRPFKQLSSGMMSRLAFSVASLVHPDILILDEVLSVGDGGFRKKSEAKMREIINGGATTILVSHSIEQVRDMCNKALWIEKGNQIGFGDTELLCDLYQRYLDGVITLTDAKAQLHAKDNDFVPEKTVGSSSAETPSEVAVQLVQAQRFPQARKRWEERIYSISLFLFAFVLSMLHAVNISPIANSGDATVVWESIKGIASGIPVASYVLYKGVMACYPYVWLYQLSSLLGLSEFFFVKIYHGVLFAYTAAICMPNIYLKLMNRQRNIWRQALFILLFFTLPKESCIFDQLMVDLPMLACFAGSTSMLLNWREQGERYPGYKIAMLGLLFGFGQCFTGQYKPAYVFLSVFMICTIYGIARRSPGYAIRKIAVWALFLLAVLVSHIAEWYFSFKVIEPLVAEGSFVSVKGELIFDALYGGGSWYSLFIPTIGSPKARVVYSAMESLPELVGQSEITVSVLIAVAKFWLQHPFDMLQIWVNRLFIGLSMGGSSHNLLYLAISYTAVYITALTLKRQAKQLLSTKRSNLLVYLAFLFAALVPSAMHMEARYAIQMQGLVLLFLSHDEYISSSVKRITRNVVQWKRESIRPGWGSPWTALLGIVFVSFCIIHFGTLMELQAIDGIPISLFQFRW